MATKKTGAKKTADGHAVEIGVGVAAAALAAGAAGYYFFGAKDAQKHRKNTARWASDMQKDVLKSAKKLKRIDAKTIANIVDEAAAVYEGVRGVNPKEVRMAAHELKENWDHIRKELSGTSAAKVAKKAVKKAVKKAPKKAAKK